MFGIFDTFCFNWWFKINIFLGIYFLYLNCKVYRMKLPYKSPLMFMFLYLSVGGFVLAFISYAWPILTHILLISYIRSSESRIDKLKKS